MSNRFLRAVLALYPRGFRRRYGPEVQGLVNDLEAAGDRSRLRLVSGLLVSAVAERLRTVRLDARLTIPALVAVAALGTIVGLNWSRGDSASSTPSHATAHTCWRRPCPKHPGLGTSARPDPRLRPRRRSRGPWRHPRRARQPAGPAAPPATAVAGPMAPPTAGTSSRPDPRLRPRRRSRAHGATHVGYVSQARTRGSARDGAREPTAPPTGHVSQARTRGSARDGARELHGATHVGHVSQARTRGSAGDGGAVTPAVRTHPTRNSPAAQPASSLPRQRYY